MKTQYKRIAKDDSNWNDRHVGRYELRFGMFRSIRTQNERRQLAGLDADGLPVRRRRLNVPTAWDDFHVVKNYKRSWKDFTKKRHQWE